MASHIISRLVAGKFFLWIDAIVVDWQALHNAARIKVTFMCRLTLHNFLFTFPLTQQRKAAKLHRTIRRSSVVEAFDASHNYSDLWILSFISGVEWSSFVTIWLRVAQDAHCPYDEMSGPREARIEIYWLYDRARQISRALIRCR